MDSFQLVVFTLGNEEYGIDISNAQEIIRIPRLTKIPNSPPFLEGIFNLRGKVIPVFDLKKKFEMSQSERGIDSRLLILNLSGMIAGIIVDDISEVMRINKASIQTLDQDIVNISKNSIEGIYVEDQRIIVLINILKLRTDIFRYNIGMESEAV